MTATHPDLTALLAAVCQFPADDTPRLVLADWLDEHGESERAEFIRVQVELARLHAVGHGTQPEDGPACPVLSFAWKNPRAGGQVMPKCRTCERAFEAEQHERELLTDTRRREWFGIKRPVCEGSGNQPGDLYDLGRCELCDGTGFAPVEVRRGCVESVRCRMGDVIASHDTPRDLVYALTPWARGVLAAHPVTRWEIVDREPARLGDKYGWWENGADEPHIIGRVLWLEMYESRRKLGWHDSPEEARDALALAVGRVARWFAGLPEATT